MRALPLLLLVLTACPPRGNDEGVHCEDTPRDIAMDEVTPIGRTAEDVIAQVPVEEATTLGYADGATTPLTLGFAPAGTARFVDSEAVYPEGGEVPAIAVICDDRIEADGVFTFATEDGAFAESFDAPVAATESAITLNVELDLDGLSGTFRIEPFVQAEDYDELRAWIDVRFAEGASSGSVAGQASGEEECDGDDCAAWAEQVPVGTWPPAE